MTPNLGGWIHNFTVTDTQTHKGGYTIYKITSIVFPRSVPQALTCLTIWKRFHDVKRLHRELLRRHKTLKLPGQLPEPTDCSFFKRFDADVICRRKEYILQLLDFVAQHPTLYKCHAFTQFFSEAQQTGVGGYGGGESGITSTPTASPLHCLHAAKDLKGGAIAEICDKLDLRYDPLDVGDINIALVDPADDKTVDTACKVVDSVGDVVNDSIAEKVTLVKEEESVVATLSTQQPDVDVRPCKDYTRFLTPMASIESDDSDYIYEAALEFSHAVQAEANLEYKEAHERYKRGVEVLLVGSKDDANDERKFIAKAKISKYLARADDIYDKFLNDNARNGSRRGRLNFQLSIDVTDCGADAQPAVYLERPWNHLAKYKVLQVLGERVMQVHCVTEPEPRATYVMKGVEKPSSNMPTQTVFLPQHVPYMVELLAFFQSEQKIFLLVKQAEGGRLYDYVQTYTPTVEKAKSFAVLFPDDAEEEGFAVEAVETDTAVEIDAAVEADVASIESVFSAQDSGYVDEGDSVPDSVKSNVTLPLSETTEFSELVRCSQQLLQSVSKTLKEMQQIEELPSVSSASASVEAAAFPTEDAVKISAPQTPEKTIVTMHATKIPEASLKQWARELAVAIHSLHAKGVILSDLHMENLLLGSKGQLLLTYFYQNEGLVAADNYIHKAYSPLAVSGHFVAPERPLTFRSDWWSYGVVLYQLLLGLPFIAGHPGHIELYGYVQYPDNVELSDSARDLLDNLLQQAPEERLDYEQIQTHAFFTGTNWDEVRRNGLNNSNTGCGKGYRNLMN